MIAVWVPRATRSVAYGTQTAINRGNLGEIAFAVLGAAQPALLFEMLVRLIRRLIPAQQ